MPCPRTQQASLPACPPHYPFFMLSTKAGKLRKPFFKVFWYDSTRGMNLRSTDYEVDALTTTPLRRSLTWIVHKLLKQIAKGWPNFFLDKSWCKCYSATVEDFESNNLCIVWLSCKSSLLHVATAIVSCEHLSQGQL